jgi:glycine cleavage system H protein
MSFTSSFLFRQAIKFPSIRQFHITSRVLQERYYTKKHEWIQMINNKNEVRIGISDFAQNALGDVVYCELPSVGTKLQRDQTFATLESVKAVADCFMPIDGEISNVNDKLKAQADLINKSPYDNGWLVQAIIDEKNKNDIGNLLMNEKKYQEFLEKNKQADDH